MLAIRNRDGLGVIGFTGSVFDDHDVNIAGTFNARGTDGGETRTVYSPDDPLADEVRAERLADGRLTEATAIELDGA